LAVSFRAHWRAGTESFGQETMNFSRVRHVAVRKAAAGAFFSGASPTLVNFISLRGIRVKALLPVKPFE